MAHFDFSTTSSYLVDSRFKAQELLRADGRLCIMEEQIEEQEPKIICPLRMSS